jgi:hypothetical protein
MSDHDRTEQTLTLLARHGAYEILLAMHTRGGAATFGQISAESPHPLALLRSMAAEGFLIGVGSGTLDADPSGDTHFSLTGKGEAVFGHMMRLNNWLASRAAAKRGRRADRIAP